MTSVKEVLSDVKKKGLTNVICDFIIRPPRSKYSLESLGPEFFRLDGDSTRFQRVDLQLTNMRGMRIECSWYKHATPLEKPLPCVVYCHANCGGRRDGLEVLDLLKHGTTVFTFDFTGSGKSEGTYISLGFYERQDLAAVVEYLQLRTAEVDGIALWGRSMGAVTSIMYASRDDSIRCVVLDSPFATLRMLISDLVVNHGGSVGKRIPTSFVRMIVNRIRSRIATRAGFDIDDLDTLKYAALCHSPGLIIHGAQDDFVPPAHSMSVRDAFAASCLHQLVEGDHNDERDEDTMELAIAYIRLYCVEKPHAERERRAAAAAAAAVPDEGSGLRPARSQPPRITAITHSHPSRARPPPPPLSAGVNRGPSPPKRRETSPHANRNHNTHIHTAKKDGGARPGPEAGEDKTGGTAKARASEAEGITYVDIDADEETLKSFAEDAEDDIDYDDDGHESGGETESSTDTAAILASKGLDLDVMGMVAQPIHLREPKMAAASDADSNLNSKTS